MIYIIEQVGTTVCLELLDRPADICAEPRGMIVFGWLVLVMTVVLMGTVAAMTWSDPGKP